MADRPRIPEQTTPPLFNQSGNRDRAGRTASAVNNVAAFADASNLYREGSPTAGSPGAVFSQLTAGAMVRMADNGVTVEEMGVMPPFYDGGYHIVDTIKADTSGRYEYPSGGSATFTAASGSNRAFLRTAGGSASNNSSEPAMLLPVAPINSVVRMRGLLGYTHTSNSGFTVAFHDGLSAPTLIRVIMVKYGAVTSNSQYVVGIFPYRSPGRVAWTYGNRRDLPSSGVVALDITVTPVNGWGRATLGVLATVYNNEAAAFADMSAGRAFSGITGEPDLGWNGGLPTGSTAGIRHLSGTSNGSVLRSSSFRPRWIQPGVRADKIYYLETLMGGLQNNVFNRRPVQATPSDSDDAIAAFVPPNSEV